MYCDDGRLCVCVCLSVSLAAFPHYCTDSGVILENDRRPFVKLIFPLDCVDSSNAAATVLFGFDRTVVCVNMYKIKFTSAFAIRNPA